MNREELLDKIEEITDKNYKTFRGTNEAELHTREEIADLIEQEKKAEVIAYMEWLNEMGCAIPYEATNEENYNQFKEATK